MNRTRPERYVHLAQHIATWSKDPSRRVGCVIIGPDNEIRSAGYNGLPRGVDDATPRYTERPEKYLWVEHAERNAIYNAARMGLSLAGCRLYTTWTVCADCARAIIQAGIISVDIGLGPNDATPLTPAGRHGYWARSMEVASFMLDESKVAVTITLMPNPFDDHTR